MPNYLIKYYHCVRVRFAVTKTSFRPWTKTEFIADFDGGYDDELQLSVLPTNSQCRDRFTACSERPKIYVFNYHVIGTFGYFSRENESSPGID